MWLLRPIVLCLALSLPLSSQYDPDSPDGPGVLLCGLQGFQLTVNLSQEAEAPPVLTTWDSHGQPHRLQNDSVCGTWVTEGPGGSVVLEATYSGCYVTQWDFHYVMPLEVATKQRLLRCPVELPAQDTPDTDLCQSVPARDRLPCAPSAVSRGDCEELGCCYSSEDKDRTYCYYGNTVTSHCTQEGHFSIAVSRNVTSPPLHLDSVHLTFQNDSGCDPVMTTHAFVLFQFPFTSCGTTRWITGDEAMYENELVATRDVRPWGNGSITRDSIFRLRVSCSYSVNSNTYPVNVQVFSLTPPPPVNQPGLLTLDLQIAKDKTYGSYYSAGEYPVVKLLRDPIYVEVSILHRTDPHLGLLLQQCWATPTPNPLHQQQWPILVKGCPYVGDNYQTQRIPVQSAVGLPFPSHHQRFSISTFSFTDPSRAKQTLSGRVYLHCSTLVCQPAGTPYCTVTCPIAGRRRKSDVYFENHTASISSKGPMILLQATKEPSEELRVPEKSPALWVAGLTGTLIIIGALFLTYLVFRKWK
ncbi:zona pellucida sperm-binding protein 4 [Castor canadensis]|uniref:Zona pellucida sperm-binding protein 4 n=1 Tax=Castor canadensis TaxID=51338 RepID=A0A8B7U5R1_CASCN